jgi:hypothetical protein
MRPVAPAPIALPAPRAASPRRGRPPAARAAPGGPDGRRAPAATAARALAAALAAAPVAALLACTSACGALRAGHAELPSLAVRVRTLRTETAHGGRWASAVELLLASPLDWAAGTSARGLGFPEEDAADVCGGDPPSLVPGGVPDLPSDDVCASVAAAAPALDALAEAAHDGPRAAPRLRVTGRARHCALAALCAWERVASAQAAQRLVAAAAHREALR